MQHADLSISRAGYNTCRNVLETGATAILIPSIAMDDQVFRATRLSDLNLAHTIHPDHLSSSTLSRAIQNSLSTSTPHHLLNLEGARHTKAYIESL